MKQLFIHIGDSKTGTSTIQKFLTENRVKNESNGFLYSRQGLLASHGIANHKLAFCINENRKEFHKDRKSLYDKLNNEILTSDCNKIVISSEGFSSLRTIEEITILRDLIDPSIQVNIVVYLRRPDKWIESWYCQAVKNRPFIKASFEEFLPNHQGPALGVTLLYGEVFGDSSIVVRTFDKKEMYNNDLVSDFHNIIKENKVGNDIESINVSPDQSCIEILRLLNKNLNIDDKTRLSLYEIILNNYNHSENKKYFSTSRRIEIFNEYCFLISEVEKRMFNGKSLFDISDLGTS